MRGATITELVEILAFSWSNLLPNQKSFVQGQTAFVITFSNADLRITISKLWAMLPGSLLTLNCPFSNRISDKDKVLDSLIILFEVTLKRNVSECFISQIQCLHAKNKNKG